MPEDQKAGTQTGASDGGDDAGELALTGTQGAAADDGDAGKSESAEEELARLRKAHEQSLAEKQTLAQVTAENEQLKRGEAARAAQVSQVTPPNVDPYAFLRTQQAQQAQQAYFETQQLANAKDPLAILTLAQMDYYAEQERKRERETQELRLEVEAGKVPEQYREDVKAALRTGKYANHEAALSAVKGSKDLPAKEAEIARLQKENESYRRADEARKAGVVGAGRSVPDLSGSRGAEPRSEAEFNAEIDRLERAGDPKARAELSRRYRNLELPFQRAG